MTQEIAIREQNTAMELPDEQTLIRQLQEINRFQKLVHSNLVNNLDFGTIPGTNKPTLLKPGAEKIAKLLGLADHYEVLDQIENWDKPFFHYKIRCSLVNMRNNVVVSTGMGECNSYEGKYRWRDSKRKCPACKAEAIIKGKAEYGGGWLCFKKQGGCGATFKDDDATITGQTIGRVDNPDICDQVNTILKMAKKRALVDAALSAGRLSDVFTQDMEDITNATFEQPSSVIPQDKPAAKQHGVTPGSDIWILDKIKALQIVEADFMKYVNETLHIPVDNTLSGTLLMLNDKQRADITKLLNTRERQKS